VRAKNLKKVSSYFEQIEVKMVKITAQGINPIKILPLSFLVELKMKIFIV